MKGKVIIKSDGTKRGTKITVGGVVQKGVKIVEIEPFTPGTPVLAHVTREVKDGEGTKLKRVALANVVLNLSDNGGE